MVGLMIMIGYLELIPSLLCKMILGCQSNALIKEFLLQQEEGSAEILFSQQMAPIIEKGQHRHAPDSYPVTQGMCRFNGNPYSSACHFQDDFN